MRAESDLAHVRDPDRLRLMARQGIPLTQAQAGVLLGLSRNRVSQIERRAMKKLRAAMAAWAENERRAAG